MSESQPVEALLFDLGGVLIDIDFDRVFRAWAPRSALSLEQIRARFSVDTAYRQHECGQLDGRGYFAHLRQLLELDAGDAEIEQGWNAVFVGEISESVAMIRAASLHLPCFVFTNTNPTHQAAWSMAYPQLITTFKQVFSSSEIGLRKPDRLAFDTVARTIGVDPARILFFDDMQENVDGARSAGLRAIQVRNPEDIRHGLADQALLQRPDD